MALLIFARPDGEWFDFPPLQLAAISGTRISLPNQADLIPLPEGATLTLMPDSLPVGFDAQTGEFLALEENPYKHKKSEPVYAVAALLPQGFTRTLLPATVIESAELCPILGYTAVGWDGDQLVVAAMQTDEHQLWHPQNYHLADLPQLIEQRQSEFPDNRIIRQLSRCAEEYGCFTAQNIFYRRWEGGIPVSPTCNAACLACLSEQGEQGPPAPQQRICFCPQAEEIAEIGIAHLQHADQPMISFGQGCEGEPSLAYAQICESIRLMRAQTARGIININTNAGDTAAIAAIIDAGIDSLRVSLFSPLPADYQAYHQPRDYGFDDVCRSLAIAAEKGVPVALNLLTYPGFSDDRQQVEALIELIGRYQIAQLQLRNLNCDPRLMEDFCRDRSPLGIAAMIALLQEHVPQLQIGNYSRDLQHPARHKQ
jgi:molybdenum cofactor biosynthesis enzyme MoaA